MRRNLAHIKALDDAGAAEEGTEESQEYVRLKCVCVCLA